MPGVKLVCPTCEAGLKLPAAPAVGKRIRCPRCGHVFVYAAPQPRAAEAVGPAAVSGKRSQEASKAARTSQRSSPLRLIAAITGAAVLLIFVALGVLIWSAGAVWRQALVLREDHKPIIGGVRNDQNQAEQNYDDWLGDFAKAKEQAVRERKELLVQVPGSYGFHENGDLLSSRDFRMAVRPHFVLAQATSEIRQPQTVRGSRSWGGITYELVIADSAGKPYAVVDQLKEEPKEAAEQIAALRSVRDQLRRNLEAVDETPEPDRLKAARAALGFLEEHGLTAYQPKELERWLKLAETKDPKNADGQQEVFFEASWWSDVWQLQLEWEPEYRSKFAERLETWKKTHRFRDANRAANMHLVVGMMQMHHSRGEAAKYFRAALAYKPTDRLLQQRLAMAVSQTHRGSSGTGFVAAPGGYVLTNNHVISGKGKLEARLPGNDIPVAVEVIGKDEERDLALLQIKGNAGDSLAPVPLAAERAPGRGEQVAVLGYPLGSLLGQGLKLTTGVVSATPEPGNGFMLILDAKVNPGNSGGPLCDASGNVVGIISMKTGRFVLSFGSPIVESYGMAIPAKEVETFLKSKLPGYRPIQVKSAKVPWNEVDRAVSPSVVMITQSE
jgi:S1-C subfamily serine protease